MITTVDKTQTDKINQLVTFKLAREVYGINVMQIQEVLRYTTIALVPGAPSYVLGIINLRGNVVTVIDSRERLGLPSYEPTDESRILIIEINHHIIGILVDSVAEVVYVRQSEIEATPHVGNDEGNRYIYGVVHKNNIVHILIDITKLLSDDELSELFEV